MNNKLIILDDDTPFRERLARSMEKKGFKVSTFASYNDCLKRCNEEYFDYAGASGGFIDYLVFPFCRGRIFDTIEKDENQYENSIDVFWTSGTAFLTRKNIFSTFC